MTDINLTVFDNVQHETIKFEAAKKHFEMIMSSNTDLIVSSLEFYEEELLCKITQAYELKDVSFKDILNVLEIYDTNSFSNKVCFDDYFPDDRNFRIGNDRLSRIVVDENSSDFVHVYIRDYFRGESDVFKAIIPKKYLKVTSLAQTREMIKNDAEKLELFIQSNKTRLLHTEFDPGI